MDDRGTWWYQVKPGFCWPVDFLEPVPYLNITLPQAKSFLGYQHIISDENSADSYLVINVIREIEKYCAASIVSKRRNAVRKGLYSCSLEVLSFKDASTFMECRATWNDLTKRTGWKREMALEEFDRTWSMTLDCPGSTIVVGRDIKSGRVAGFLITKIIGSTAYVDTIASRDEFLGCNVNDALIYSFLSSSKVIPGVINAHYAIKSKVEGLEKFKTGIGFVPFPYPASTRLKSSVRLGLKVFMPDQYNRIIGKW